MPDIRHSIVIQKPPATVFPLVASAAGFTRWWSSDVTEHGGAVELGFFERATVYALEPVKLHAPDRAEWRCTSGDEWKGTRLVFELAPAQGGASALKFTHAGWRRETDYFIACTTTWGELMFRIKAAAEGKAPGALFTAAGMSY